MDPNEVTLKNLVALKRCDSDSNHGSFSLGIKLHMGSHIVVWGDWTTQKAQYLDRFHETILRSGEPGSQGPGVFEKKTT